MSKLVKKLAFRQGDQREEFYFDATTGVKGYEYYSSEETIVGKWIDGKPIYRKTLYIPSLPKSTSTKYVVGPDEVDAVIRCDGWTDTAAGTNKFTLPYYNQSTASYSIWVYHGTPNSITVTTGADRSSQYAYITCEYTKKKDSTNSFEEEQIELTAEHKTGETLNSKPVYELTITGNMPTGQSSVFEAAPYNIEDLISLVGTVMQNNGNWLSTEYFNASSNHVEFYLNPQKQVVAAFGGSYYPGQKFIVTLKYTKTTD